MESARNNNGDPLSIGETALRNGVSASATRHPHPASSNI